MGSERNRVGESEPLGKRVGSLLELDDRMIRAGRKQWMLDDWMSGLYDRMIGLAMRLTQLLLLRSVCSDCTLFI